ncbi:hypothetical protein Tco_1369731 [Tanacetum coccineum]
MAEEDYFVGGQLWWPDNSKTKKFDSTEAFKISIATIMSSLVTNLDYKDLKEFCCNGTVVHDKELGKVIQLQEVINPPLTDRLAVICVGDFAKIVICIRAIAISPLRTARSS